MNVFDSGLDSGTDAGSDSGADAKVDAFDGGGAVPAYGLPPPDAGAK